VLVVVPRLVAGLLGESDRPPIGGEIWSDAEILLPHQARGASFRNIFTGETLECSLDSSEAEAPCRLPVSAILRTFPVAVLLRLNGAARD
jgi:(1->4)-alpha-D-glucan 1-alpha-D-glucosylmutase